MFPASGLRESPRKCLLFRAIPERSRPDQPEFVQNSLRIPCLQGFHRRRRVRKPLRPPPPILDETGCFRLAQRLPKSQRLAGRSPKRPLSPARAGAVKRRSAGPTFPTQKGAPSLEPVNVPED